MILSIIIYQTFWNHIEKTESIIISLREGSPESKERATLEYYMSNVGLKRIQSRGRFNRILEKQWDVPIEVLDNRVEILYKNKKIDIPKYKKEYKNGKEIIVSTILGEPTEVNLGGYIDDMIFPF